MRRVLACLVIAGLLLATAAPARGSTAVVASRCASLTTVLNASRSPDVKVLDLLCVVGAQRAYTMARAGRTWHDLAPVKRALTNAHVCWRNVGEVLAWNTYSATASAFMAQWKKSSAHWTILVASRYDRGGGAWTGYGGKYFAAYYVLDVC